MPIIQVNGLLQLTYINIVDSRSGGRNFYLGVELIKCIDPNEGEALRRGV